MTLPEWINNAWFVGIVGGILSGLIVAYISRLLFSRKDSREYLQKVSSVNREIIYSLRPGISEGNIPNKDIIEALIMATCRKYGVNQEDVLNTTGIAEELIKEVMDSSFIASATKIDYCQKLMTLKESQPITVVETESKVTTVDSGEIRKKLLTQSSMILGVIVALMTASLTVITTVFEKFPTNNDTPDRTFQTPVLVLIVALTSLFLTFLIFPFLKTIRNTIDERFDNEREEPKDLKKIKDKFGSLVNYAKTIEETVEDNETKK